MKKLRTWLNKHIDYRITGEYYDTVTDKYGRKILKKKYIKKYYLK